MNGAGLLLLFGEVLRVPDPMLAVSRRSPKNRAKPTSDFIVELEQTLRSHFQEQDDQVALLRRVREQTESVPLPASLTRVHGIEMNDPAVGDEIKRIVSSVNSRPPRCSVIPANPLSDTEQLNTELREKWTEQALHEAGITSSGVNAHEQNIDACFGDGAAWCKLLYDRHRWEAVWDVPDTMDYWLDSQDNTLATPDTPANRLTKGKKPKTAEQYLTDRETAKKAAGVPFRLINVDVNTIFPLWRGDDLVSVIESVERPVIELMDTYQVTPPGNLRNVVYGPGVNRDEATQYGETARFLTYTDAQWICYLVVWQAGGEAEIVRTVKHGYGFVPYFFAPGYMFSYWRGRKVGWGIAQDWVKLARYRQFLWNLVVNIAAQTAGTPIAHTRPEGGEPMIGETDLPKGEVQLWQLNGLYEAAPGEDFKAIPLPGVPEPLKELLTIINNMIDKLQTPRVNAIGTDMSGAGFAYAQIFAEIKVSYDVYVKHLEQMYVQVTRALWRLMREQVQEKVYVHYTPSNPKSHGAKSEWLGAGPEDLSDGVGVKWIINADPPTAEIVLARYWGERLQQQTASLDQAIEALGSNPAEVRRGQLADKMRKEPEFQQLMKREVLQTLDSGDLMKKAAILAAQSGMVPGLPPQIAAGVMQQHLEGGPGAMPPGAPPGSPMLPDQANLSMAPQGQGAAPLQGNPYAGAGGPGATPGAPNPALPPARSMAPALQAIR